MDTEQSRRVALVCGNFSMQGAFAFLILALNSARLGCQTLIHFTFERLNMLRPGYLEKLGYHSSRVEASEDEAARFTEKLRQMMYDKDIPYCEDMLEMAQLEGVRFLACKTSVDLFDLTQDDFIDGVENTLAEYLMK